MNFNSVIASKVLKRNSSLCVGLDPEFDKIPDICRKSSEPFFEFNKRIIDATHEFVTFYKPQFAHYGAFKKEAELEKTIEYIKTTYPDIIVILDSKRGDIGNTAKYYAIEAFERYGADAVTVNPYMGVDSIKPFTDYHEKGVFILCKTSNPSSSDLQNVSITNNLATPHADNVCLLIAEKTQNAWNTNSNAGLVVGATFPAEMSRIRQQCGDKIPFLIPGIGAQGGDLNAVITSSYAGPGSIIINSSRGIIHRDSSSNFDVAARKEANKLNSQINTEIGNLNI